MNSGTPSSQAVLEGLLERHRLGEPDGRPLYRYRARSSELTSLRHALTEELGSSSPGRWTAMGLVLWASEWWRRKYEGGAWKWESLLTELHHREFAPTNARYRQLQDIVLQGLDTWRREILLLGSSRQYLATLACEAGLPLSLLKRDTDTHLRTYMRVVMEEYKLFRSDVRPYELAEQARHFLPRSWRQPMVYELAGDLVRRIWSLQQGLRESTTPVVDLDRTCPGWRTELPVRLPDHIAHPLLNGLLLDAAEVARGGRSRVRWDVEVNPVDDDQWEARGSYRLPKTMDSAMFNNLFGRTQNASVPGRFDVCVQVHGRTVQPLAIATPRRPDDPSKTNEDRTYNLELLPFARKHHTSDIDQPRDLVARSLNASYRTSDFPGAAGLHELPWVFAPQDASLDTRQPCRLVGQGSVKIREPWGLVAGPSDVSVDAHAGASVEAVGVLRNADRCMYRVSGCVAFSAEDGSRSVVETGARSGTGDVEYRLYGKQSSWMGSDSRPYLGKPILRKWHDGNVELVPDESIEWRPNVAGCGWQPYAATNAIRGSGVLRYMTDGEVHHTVPLCVLPQGADVEVRPSSDLRHGQILLRGFGNVLAAVRQLAGVHVSCRVVDSADCCLDLIAKDDIPREVTVVVDWHGQGRAELRLPFPSERATFLDANGDDLPSGTSLPVGYLARIRAEVVIPGAAEFSVQGQYSGRDAPELNRSYGLFIQPMEEVSRGHYTLELSRVQPAVDARLSRSDDPDGRVTLTISSNQRAGSLPPTQIKVGQFDLDLQPGEADYVKFSLVGASHGQTSEDDLAELEIEAIALANPCMQPTTLPSVLGELEWHSSDAINPGPYLIVGRQGTWHRVRPLFWYAGDRVDPQAEATCEAAYAQWNGGAEKLEAFHAVARRLADQPSSADRDWELVFAYLDESALPVQVFPLLRGFVECPQACAMAAVIASRGQLHTLWGRMKDFHFAWWQVPWPCWETALTAYATFVGSELEGCDHADSILTEIITSRLKSLKRRLPGLDPAFGFLRAKLLDTPIPSDSARIAKPQVLAVLQKQYTDHQRKCPAGQGGLRDIQRLPGIPNVIQALRQSIPWATRLFVNRVGPFTKHVLANYADAPAVTAFSVLSGDKMSADLARAIREGRERHPKWFDEALRLAQLIAFGRDCANNIRELSLEDV